MKLSNDKQNGSMYINDNPSMHQEGRGAYMMGGYNDIFPAIDQRLTVGDEKQFQPWHADMRFEGIFKPENRSQD